MKPSYEFENDLLADKKSFQKKSYSKPELLPYENLSKVTGSQGSAG